MRKYNHPLAATTGSCAATAARSMYLKVGQTVALAITITKSKTLTFTPKVTSELVPLQNPLSYEWQVVDPSGYTGTSPITSTAQQFVLEDVGATDVFKVLLTVRSSDNSLVVSSQSYIVNKSALDYNYYAADMDFSKNGSTVTLTEQSTVKEGIISGGSIVSMGIDIDSDGTWEQYNAPPTLTYTHAGDVNVKYGVVFSASTDGMGQNYWAGYSIKI